MDADSLDAFRRREAGGVRALYREYGRLVYAVAHRVLGQHDLAEEATQQTFVRAWQAAERFDVDRDPAPWLATIAKRTAIDIYRREARRPTVALADVAAERPGAGEPAARPRYARRGVARPPCDRRASARRSDDRPPAASRRHDAPRDLRATRHRVGNREVEIAPRAPEDSPRSWAISGASPMTDRPTNKSARR